MSYRAGIIGAGGIAGLGILGMHDEEDIGEKKFEASHAGGYRATDEIELVAVSDPDTEKLKRFGEVWEISTDYRYENHMEMLTDGDLDVVSVCTPTFLHEEHVLDAATSQASPDVIWCEKPIASSVSAAEKMQAVCTETDTQLVINHSFRFTDKLQKMRNLITDGIIGEVKSVHTQFRRELLRNSTHLLDSLVYLLDSRADRIAGYLNGENDAADALEADQPVDDVGGGGIVVMADGTFTTVDCTIAREISSMQLQFIGTEGKLLLNNDDGEWRYWNLEGKSHCEEELPGIESAWSWEEDYRGAFANAARHVRDLLDGTAENHSSGDDATRSLEIIIGFYLSHYTDGFVDIPLERPLRDVTINSW